MMKKSCSNNIHNNILSVSCMGRGRQRKKSITLFIGI